MGVPRDEVPLVSTLLARVSGQYAVARGHARIVVEQAALPSGVPDILVIHASASSLRRLERSALRLRTPHEAATLARLFNGDELTGHNRTQQRRLEEAGWLATAAGPANVSEAIAYEVKVRDWQAGINQLTRYMKFTSRGALALPTEAAKRIPRRFLQTNGIGLITIDEDRVTQVRKGRSRPLSVAAQLWLAELAVRALSDR